MLMNRKTRNHGGLMKMAHPFLRIGFKGYESPRRLAMGQAEQPVPNSESVCSRLVASKGVPGSELARGGMRSAGGTKLRADLLLD